MTKHCTRDCSAPSARGESVPPLPHIGEAFGILQCLPIVRGVLDDILIVHPAAKRYAGERSTTEFPGPLHRSTTKHLQRNRPDRSAIDADLSGVIGSLQSDASGSMSRRPTTTNRPPGSTERHPLQYLGRSALYLT